MKVVSTEIVLADESRPDWNLYAEAADGRFIFEYRFEDSMVYTVTEPGDAPTSGTGFLDLQVALQFFGISTYFLI
jgi:hypothetical protein